MALCDSLLPAIGFRCFGRHRHGRHVYAQTAGAHAWRRRGNPRPHRGLVHQAPSPSARRCHSCSAASGLCWAGVLRFSGSHRDSALEEASLERTRPAKFPASWEKYREFCSSRPPSATIGSKSIAEFNGLRPNSLRIGTGNLIRPCRELIRAIREFFRLIRESGADRDFTAAVNQMSDQLADDEQGCRRERSGSAGSSTCPNVTDGLLALGSAAQVRPEVTTAPAK